MVEAPAGSPTAQALSYAAEAVFSLPFLGEFTEATISELGDTQFNYAVSQVWPGTDNLCIYSYGTATHYGTAGGASNLLDYVKRQTSGDKYRGPYTVVPIPVPTGLLSAELSLGALRNHPARDEIEGDILRLIMKARGSDWLSAEDKTRRAE